jgi:hypothetical protein
MEGTVEVCSRFDKLCLCCAAVMASALLKLLNVLRKTRAEVRQS